MDIYQKNGGFNLFIQINFKGYVINIWNNIYQFLSDILCMWKTKNLNHLLHYTGYISYISHIHGHLKIILWTVKELGFNTSVSEAET